MARPLGAGDDDGVEQELERLARSSYWTEADGRSAVELWRRSGMKRIEFCSRSGIGEKRLARWAKRLEGRVRPDLVEVDVAGLVEARAAVPAVVIEIGAARVFVNDGATEQLLVEVLRAVVATC